MKEDYVPKGQSLDFPAEYLESHMGEYRTEPHWKNFFKKSPEEQLEWATEPCHLVVKVGENRYLDVDGEKDEEELKQNCFFSGPVEEVEIVPTTPREAQGIFTMEGVSDEDVERAKDFIRQQQGNK